jgi:hypothetical protein
MALIEEKGFGLPAFVRKNVVPAARNVSRQGRNETATLATPLYKRLQRPGIKNNKVPLQLSIDRLARLSSGKS